eukprot:1157261-Pelagomonas_calceolata.AAC.8
MRNGSGKEHVWQCRPSEVNRCDGSIDLKDIPIAIFNAPSRDSPPKQKFDCSSNCQALPFWLPGKG